MFTISKENLDETRIEKLEPDNNGWDFVDIIGAEAAESTTTEPQDSGATQRVFVSDDGVPSTTPITPTDRPQPTPRRRQVSAEQRAAAIAARKKKEKITIITLCSIVAVLLIAVVVVIVGTLGTSNDNGLIFNNVFAAGVDLSGMTPDQAKIALQNATQDTYSQLDMTVQVLDSTVTLSPVDTGAKLNVNAVVEAAYNFGRTGSRAERQQAKKLLETSTYAIPLDDYLTLDTGYIKDVVDKLGKTYSTTLSQTTISIEGERPADAPDPEEVDLTKVYQTLYIKLGTAEYGFNTDRLYSQILEAYSQNLFQVTGECSLVTPDPIDCDAVFAEYCSAAVDASIDPETYVVTPEIYGYGISLDDLKTMVAEAKYGETLVIPMTYIEPAITSKLISEDLFKDTLSAFQTSVSADAGWNTNMELACGLLNNFLIKAGEEFSFNDVIGEPTVKDGFKAVDLYVGKAMTNMVGGGLSQVASTLYNCALIADLEILERNPHTYSPAFIETGFDAQVIYGSMDLRFKNNTEHPIRIEAATANGFVQIRLIGTDTKEYTVDIAYEITNTKNPQTEFITVMPDNPGNHVDGEIFAEGITGYDVSTYKYTYDKETGRQLSKDLIASTSYARRNKQIIQIFVPEPTEPPTQAPTEGATEQPTEAATEVPTEAPTEAPTDDDPTEAPTNG